MNIVDNLYSSGPMAPMCQIKEHLAIFTDYSWHGFAVEWAEPVPRSSPFIVDLVDVTGAGTLVPGQTVQGQILGILQQDSNDLGHYRWFVLDDIEGQLWQLSNMARFSPRGGQAGVNLFTPMYDPWLATTTFWVLGGLGDKDARIGCTNISGATIPQARIAFFGYRYILNPEPQVHANARYIPAQGR